MSETTKVAPKVKPVAVKTKKWSIEPAMRRKRASPVKATQKTPQASHSRPTCTSPIIEDATKLPSPKSSVPTSSSPVAPKSVERASPIITTSVLSAKKSSAKKASPVSQQASSTKIAHESPFISSGRRRKSLGSAGRVRTPMAMVPSPVTPEVVSEEQQHLSAEISPVQDALAQEMADEHDDEPDAEAVLEDKGQEVSYQVSAEEVPEKEDDAEMSLEEEEAALMQMINSAVNEKSVNDAIFEASQLDEDEEEKVPSPNQVAKLEVSAPAPDSDPLVETAYEEEEEKGRGGGNSGILVTTAYRGEWFSQSSSADRGITHP